MPRNERLTDFEDHILCKLPSPTDKVALEEVSTAIRKFSTATGRGIPLNYWTHEISGSMS